MAQSLRRAKGAPPQRSLLEIIRAGPTSTMEALAFAFLGLAAGLGLGLSPAAREWSREALGYGWIPVAVWTAAALAAFRYHRHAVQAYWRWWVVAAAIVAISIGVLSQFHPGEGILAETGMSGRWGGVLGGSSLGLALAKLTGVVLLTPLLLFPKPVGRTYLLGLRYLGLGLQFAPVYAYMGLYRSYYFLDRQFRSMLNPILRQRSISQARAKLRKHLPTMPRTHFGVNDELESPLDPTTTNGPLDMWANTERGMVPAWSDSESDFGSNTDKALPEPSPDATASKTNPRATPYGWRLPTIDLLSPPEPTTNADGQLQQMARHVESTLSEHGVNVEVKDIKAGPRVVRFGLVPGWIPRKTDGGRSADLQPGASKAGESEVQGARNRVKVQSILMREKDLALALQTPYLRIEAPVPGEALVGLEVPSPSPNKVHLRAVMETPSFALLASKGGLPIAMGQDTGGAPVIMDLTSMPHMLIAGATGSGKSVCINSVVATLLLTKPPDQLRLLMVDPKRVELTPYNGIPHLIMPVIVEVDQVNTALRGLMREMLRRYKQMEEVGARNITTYNNKADQKMPYLVLLVDELADLMIGGGFEVEQNLVRLAQLGRATGIHLVLATQRPSVNVVTGLLKANVPVRAAFAVASQVDSRVILDSIGAEKLLGRGDMLLLHNESPKPRRVQGTLVYDEEVDRLVDHWNNQKGPALPEIPMGDFGDDDEEEEVDDRVMDQARDLALRNSQLSPSFLERRLKVGAWKATQIIGLLEDEGLLQPR